MSTENKLVKKKRRNQNIAFGIFSAVSYSIVALLFVILAFIVVKGIGVISWEFITEMPKDGMTSGGVFPAIVGTLCLVLVSMLFAFPVGVLAALYMNEYVKEGWVKKIIKQMTNNLAGVPSIVFGLFGMSLFVNKLGFGDSILAGGLTLGLLVLPVVIRTTEESLKAVDDTFRQASLGLGASKWQTTRNVVFPIAFPNIITGLILSIGRVSGETAPILFTVAAYFLPKLPTSIFDQAHGLALSFICDFNKWYKY
ncbi:phosphate ABC transporter permease PstA [Flavobacterium faecale]|uniref:phosphate ABC transporter permease PstA n=1 Tax=Flavobacterium faecale TaxID=1355330 RepID=UPI003AAF45B7